MLSARLHGALVDSVRLEARSSDLRIAFQISLQKDIATENSQKQKLIEKKNLPKSLPGKNTKLAKKTLQNKNAK